VSRSSVVRKQKDRALQETADALEAQRRREALALALARARKTAGDRLGTTGAGTAFNSPIFWFFGQVDLVSAVLFPYGALTANDTDYVTVRLKTNDGAGGADVILGEFTSKTAASGGSGNWLAGRAIKFPAFRRRRIEAGRPLILEFIKAGAGVATPVLWAGCEYEEVAA
jgi:hypothetical protein